MHADGRGYQTIPLAVTPWVISPEADRYLKTVFRSIRRLLNRTLIHYFEDPRLQAVLPLKEQEIAWIKKFCPQGIPPAQTLIERIDTNLGPQSESELLEFQIMELNSVGVGCIYLMPTGCEIIEQRILPVLKELFPDIQLAPSKDYRQLVVKTLLDHGKALGQAESAIGFVEKRDTGPGDSNEFEEMVAYCKQLGIPAVTGDPREVQIQNGGLVLRGQKTNLFYRDFQLEEIAAIKAHGTDLSGIERAFERNQVVSTLLGEFDHKSLCELLSSPEFSAAFTPGEQQMLKKHIPWTRLVSERKTADSDGKEIDLPIYLKTHAKDLVLKPNRGYGGDGVAVGEKMEPAEWEQALQKALAKPNSWVVQKKVKLRKAPMILVNEQGRMVTQELYATLGVTATAHGVGFVGRCSDQPVVNISQGGGLVPVFIRIG